MTLWELLEIPASCTDDELKSAYRKKCKELHPDTNGGDPKKSALFVEMKRVYEEVVKRRAEKQEEPMFTMTFTSGLGPIIMKWKGL